MLLLKNIFFSEYIAICALCLYFNTKISETKRNAQKPVDFDKIIWYCEHKKSVTWTTYGG